MVLYALHVILVAFLLKSGKALGYAITTDVVTTAYHRCQRGYKHDGQKVETASARSAVECATKCSQTFGCEAVNVCPEAGPSRDVTCTMMSDRNAGQCSGLVQAASPYCLFLQKNDYAETRDTTAQPSWNNTAPSWDHTWPSWNPTWNAPSGGPSECQNGGTPRDLEGYTSCDCPSSYRGSTCGRYIRDCKEAGTGFGLHTVQPVTAPQPYQVECVLSGTYFWKRSDNAVHTLSWAQAIQGFGIVASSDYVISLDAIHHLTAQGSYRLTVLAQINIISYYLVAYENFTMGSEAEFFTVSYGQFSVLWGWTPSDGLPTPPLQFCTSDRDCNGCSAANGGLPGWYNATCGGFSPFGNMLKWPSTSGSKTLIKIVFSLERISPSSFSDEDGDENNNN